METDTLSSIQVYKLQSSDYVMVKFTSNSALTCISAQEQTTGEHTVYVCCNFLFSILYNICKVELYVSHNTAWTDC